MITQDNWYLWKKLKVFNKELELWVERSKLANLINMVFCYFSVSNSMIAEFSDALWWLMFMLLSEWLDLLARARVFGWCK